MSDPIRLIIVTDNPEKAAPAIFCMPLARLPGWVRVEGDWQKIARLEPGTPCMALWFRKGNFISLAEHTWRDRRLEVALDDDFQRQFDRVTEWLDKRDAADREALRLALLDMSDAPRSDDTTGSVPAQVARQALDASPAKTFPKQSKWR